MLFHSNCSYLLVRIPCKQRQVEQERGPLSGKQEKQRQEGMRGSLREHELEAQVHELHLLGHTVLQRTLFILLQKSIGFM